ncbi:MAG: hypothetical protein ACR2LL_04520, partial [Nitrosopumilus sp.]
MTPFLKEFFEELLQYEKIVGNPREFEKLIESGQYTIVRISALHIPHHVQPLAIQAFVIKLWFTIQE